MASRGTITYLKTGWEYACVLDVSASGERQVAVCLEGFYWHFGLKYCGVRYYQVLLASQGQLRSLILGIYRPCFVKGA